MVWDMCIRERNVSMDIGSNYQVIIMNDANIELAMDACVSSAFCAASQNCLHVKRIYIQDKLYYLFA